MQLSFTCLDGEYAISRLPAKASVPDWATGPGLINITQADDETSIVCLAGRVPAGVEADKGWCALRVDTLADLDEPGVVMAAVTPISTAGLGVFVLSTHLRDYLLVRCTERPRVQDLLAQAGHQIA